MRRLLPYPPTPLLAKMTRFNLPPPLIKKILAHIEIYGGKPTELVAQAVTIYLRFELYRLEKLMAYRSQTYQTQPEPISVEELKNLTPWG